MQGCRSGPGKNCGLPAACFGGQFTANGQAVQCGSVLAPQTAGSKFSQTTTPGGLGGLSHTTSAGDGLGGLSISQQPQQTSLPLGALSQGISALGGGSALVSGAPKDSGNSISMSISTMTVILLVSSLSLCCCVTRNPITGQLECTNPCKSFDFTLVNPLQMCLGGELDDFIEKELDKLPDIIANLPIKEEEKIIEQVDKTLKELAVREGFGDPNKQTRCCGPYITPLPQGMHPGDGAYVTPLPQSASPGTALISMNSSRHGMDMQDPEQLQWEVERLRQVQIGMRIENLQRQIRQQTRAQMGPMSPSAGGGSII